MIGKIIFGLIGVPFGIVVIIYTRYIVEHITGSIPFAERYFGSAGTYNFVRLVGILMFFVSLLVMFGFADWVYYGIFSSGSAVVAQ